MVGTQWPRRGEDDADHCIELGPGVLPPPPHRRRADFLPFGRWVPWLVPVFVVANFAMFAVAMYVNNCPAHSNKCVGTSLLGRFAFEPFEENYFLGPSLATLEKMGGLDAKKVVNNHQAWRLITCIWLHGGVVHLLANMLGLLFIGIRLEQEFGFVRIGVLYVTAGFGGSMLSALVAQSRYSVGASGALFGLLGAMLSELLTNWTIYSNKFAALLTLVLVIAINMAIGLLPHVDNAAHIGGFISGFLLGFVILVRPQFAWVKRKNAPVGYHTGSAKCKHNIYQYILWIVSAFLLIVGFTAGLVMLFQGVDLDEYCSWCHYLSCIPTKRWNCEQPVKKCNVFQSGIHFNLTCVDSGRIHDLVIAITSDAGINKQLNNLCVKLCS